MYEYLYTCHCCKSTEGVEMRQGVPLCGDCADLHQVHSLTGEKVAKQQQAEDRLIKAVKGA